ncbi:MAG: hypothetical protein CM15mP59_1760 [Flavobacteriaceae bacterium]|nr:MAG: hypothetical protein CM15mP59_1760 [Flavobacteriaceae bacterium]
MRVVIQRLAKQVFESRERSWDLFQKDSWFLGITHDDDMEDVRLVKTMGLRFFLTIQTMDEFIAKRYTG